MQSEEILSSINDNDSGAGTEGYPRSFSDQEMSMLTGSCLCGTVQYEIRSDLGPILMCHCSKCRKANGSAFAANSPIDAQHFKLVSGEEALAQFESTAGVFRVFCKHCGSPLYSKRKAAPDVIRLRIGTLDSAIESKPTAHIFVGSKAEWYEIFDELPQHLERPQSG